MQFNDVVGQQDLKANIISLVRQDHLPHALLFAGRDGSGGLPLAMATAQFIICENRLETDSCGECAACTKMAKMQHPDMHFSFPTYKKDANKIPVSNDFIRDFREFILANPYGNDTEWLKFLDTDKQGNITALECREIILKLQMRSFESEYKILIMWYPEYLEKEGNILLKLIEEPTDKTLIFFVTSNPDDILPTILSRTQLFPLKRLTDNEIRTALIQKGVLDENAIRFSRMAEGDFHKALSLMADTSSDFIETLRNWLNCIYANKGLELVDWIGKMVDNTKEHQKKFIDYVIQLLEHLIRYRTLGPANLVMTGSEQKMIEVLIAKGISDHAIMEVNDLLNESIYQIERNANTKILFHSLSLRIQKIVLRTTAIMQS